MVKVDLGNYVKTREAGRRLGVNPATVTRFIHQGQLRAIKLGGDWYVKKDDLEDFARTYAKVVGQLNLRRPVRLLPVDLSNYLKVAEVTRRLGIDKGSVLKMIYQGKFPATKIKDIWFIEKDKFEAFVKTYVKRKRQKRSSRPIEGEIDLANYVKVNEAARWLRMNPGHVRKMIYRGELPAIRVGKAWFIEWESILENMPPIDLSNYLTTPEVGQQLGVDYTTVERMIRRGQLAAVRVRRFWFVRKDEVESIARAMSKASLSAEGQSATVT